MRTYLVIPEHTTLIRVEASSPHFAVSKARRGAGAEPVSVPVRAVVPMSALVDEQERRVIPGQMTFEEAAD